MKSLPSSDPTAHGRKLLRVRLVSQAAHIITITEVKGQSHNSSTKTYAVHQSRNGTIFLVTTTPISKYPWPQRNRESTHVSPRALSCSTMSTPTAPASMHAIMLARSTCHKGCSGQLMAMGIPLNPNKASGAYSHSHRGWDDIGRHTN